MVFFRTHFSSLSAFIQQVNMMDFLEFGFIAGIAFNVVLYVRTDYRVGLWLGLGVRYNPLVR